MSEIWEELSNERKKLQADGDLPEWMSTMGFQMFRDKYLFDARTYEEQIDRIVSTLGKYCYSRREYYQGRWKTMLMDKEMYLATPVLANTGTNRGMSVSCSGGYIGDDVFEFGEARTEQMVLTKQGFGTSSYLGAIRCRGSAISGGGTANGAVPVFDDMVRSASNISQGGVRRGAWAGYLPLRHGDFYELVTYVKNNPDGANVGWCIYDADIEAMDNGDTDVLKRFQAALQLKMITGKGYFVFMDKIARAQPEAYRIHKLKCHASNLCTEITLHSDLEHTYSCVIGGMIATTYDKWKNTDAVQCCAVFLDCLVSEFLHQARDTPGLVRAVRGTEKGRPIGIGLTGLHSLYQSKGMEYGGLPAHLLNREIYKHIQDEWRVASKWMGKEWGEPEWCVGSGYRNTHGCAQAPNTSSSLIFGSDSQGATPWYGNVYNEGSASGNMFRVNPLFIELLKRYGQYNDEVLQLVLNDNGSCQSLDFLSDEEKKVFLTFFEIDQMDVLRQASGRQPFICQAQSINLAFDADEDEAVIARVHQVAFQDENIKSLYYIRSKAGVNASTGGCTACES